MTTSIPTGARSAVRIRSHHRCCRCLVPAPNGHLHHRRTRSVDDEHQHCVCNLVLLCARCHRDVHAFPVASREAGFIVSRFETEPATVPYRNNLGLTFTDCLGGVRVET